MSQEASVEDRDVVERLEHWLAEQDPDLEGVRVEGLDRVDFGHSAETLLFTMVWRRDGEPRRRDVVARIRPPPPGLLPPYDLRRQFDVLRALEGTGVRAPRVYAYESTGEVLGRDLYVMERLPGVVYEREVPAELTESPHRVRRMTTGIVDQLAAIHLVDLDATGLARLADGARHLDAELDRWEGELRRLRKGSLPALERLAAELRRQQPAPCPVVTLVHGDPKPGNFAFVGDEVSAVFDWELATVGDPLTDVGWAEILWNTPVGLTAQPGALTADEMVQRWSDLTGIEPRNRAWYRAMQGFKMAVILLSGAMLFDDGHSDDLRFVEMGVGVPFLTEPALRELGVTDDLEHGPVMPRQERITEVRAASSGT